jgi:cephalosporin hydroxylase
MQIAGMDFQVENGVLLYKDVQILKAPWDIETMLALINEVKPDLIVETGTAYGGSANLYADKIGETNRMHFPSVVTIDDRSHYGDHDLDPETLKGYIENGFVVKRHPEVYYCHTSSLDLLTLEEVALCCTNRRVLVNLDSDHHAEHVYAELKAYANFVSIGSYMVVEDMMIALVHPEHGDGPNVGVERFLKEDKRFVVEAKWNKSHSINQGGYLRRIR